MLEDQGNREWSKTINECVDILYIILDLYT
mgnify:FL=1